MQELTLAVVGIDFPNENGSNRRSEAMMTVPGAPIELVPEPKNKHDPNAIAVFSPNGVQLGFVNAERAPYVGLRIGRGEDVVAIFQGIDGGSAFIRVRFGGGAPTLPPARTSPLHRHVPQGRREGRSRTIRTAFSRTRMGLSGVLDPPGV